MENLIMTLSESLVVNYYEFLRVLVLKTQKKITKNPETRVPQGTPLGASQGGGSPGAPQAPRRLSISSRRLR